MPVVSSAIQAALVANLAGVSFTGSSLPTFCGGIADGLALWVPTITVSTMDVGTVGVGQSVPLPVTIIPAVMYSSLLAGLAANSLVGTAAPKLALGLANGMVTSFAQMLVSTTHPSVGVGAGAATFITSSATPSFLAGFAGAGMTGSSAISMCKSLSLALDMVFTSLVLPVVIVGTPSQAPSTGSGTGKIV